MVMRVSALLGLLISTVTAFDSQRFSIKDDAFSLDGQELQIYSGSLHYWRVPRPYWQNRMQSLKALGTLHCTAPCRRRLAVSVCAVRCRAEHPADMCAVSQPCLSALCISSRPGSVADALWGLHEPLPDSYTFQGNLDLAAFLQLAADEGLYVILRPGPYICAEQSFGGLPWWLGSSKVLCLLV